MNGEFLFCNHLVWRLQTVLSICDLVCIQNSDHSLALFFRDQHFAFKSWDQCVPCDIVTK